MKKALQISLARTLFTVEEDAYARLDGYLGSIRAALANDAGRDEIIGDVEGRIAEKFMESGKGIITIAEVEEVIASMGEASAFQQEGTAGNGAGNYGSASGAGADAGGAAGSSAGANASGTTKKLYRDPKNAIVGGVCAGLAAYFDVDAVWIRLAFVLLAFANGFGFLVYLVLWLVTPEAKSATQRLEMEGTPVNLATIAENARDTMQDLSNKHGDKVREVVGTTTSAAGRAVRAVVRAVAAVFRVAVALFLVVTTAPVVLGLSIFVPFVLGNPNGPYFGFPLTDAVAMPVLWMGAISGYFLAALPCVLLFLVAIGLLRRKSILNAKVVTALCLLWAAALIVGAASLAKAMSSAEEYARTSPLFEVSERSITVIGPVNEVQARNGVRVTLVQGDALALEMSGRIVELDAMRVSEADGILTLARERGDTGMCLFCDTRPVSVTLTLPNAEAIRAEGGSRVQLDGWKAEAPLALEATNGSRLEARGVFTELHASATGGSRVILKGSADDVRVNAVNGSNAEVDVNASAATLEAEGGSRIDAEQSTFDGVRAAARNGANVGVGDSQTLNATASGGAVVRYLGSPKVTKSENGGGRVKGVDVPYDYEDFAQPQDTEAAAPSSPNAPVAPAAQ